MASAVNREISDQNEQRSYLWLFNGTQPRHWGLCLSSPQPVNICTVVPVKQVNRASPKTQQKRKDAQLTSHCDSFGCATNKKKSNNKNNMQKNAGHTTHAKETLCFSLFFVAWHALIHSTASVSLVVHLTRMRKDASPDCCLFRVHRPVRYWFNPVALVTSEESSVFVCSLFAKKKAQPGHRAIVGQHMTRPEM
jgi:hypothetical protein